jgi:regulator of cell morphogenesis and NO signaling
MAHTDSDRLLVLLDHIITTHHAYVRRAVPDITRQLRSVSVAAGAERPELPLVLKTFEHMSGPLLFHLDKEEHLLFPYIRELAVAAADGRQMPVGPFGSVVHPVRMMEDEHESALEDLLILEELTRQYAPPLPTLPGVADVYAALKRFDADLREHIRKEDHDLFPSALDLEARLT